MMIRLTRQEVEDVIAQYVFDKYSFTGDITYMKDYDREGVGELYDLPDYVDVTKTQKAG